MRLLTKRKGYFYTITVLVLLSAFISLLYIIRPVSNPQHSRVASLNDFIKDLHEDMGRATYIAGFRTLITMEDYITETGDYISDLPGTFSQIFFYGSIGNFSSALMENSSFSNYIGRVSEEARKEGIRLNMTITNITLYQIDPWRVAVDFEAGIRIEDLRGSARWNYTKKFSTIIPIWDLKDPVYVVGTEGRLPNTIRTIDFELFVNDTNNKNDTAVLQNLIDKSYYVASPKAPDYIMRLTGDLSPSPYGIESLVNLEEISAQGLTIHSKRSVVDYLYFSQGESADWCSIQNMPSYFKIDDNHLAFYQISGRLDYSACS